MTSNLIPTNQEALNSYLQSSGVPLLTFKQGIFRLSDEQISLGVRCVAKVLEHQIGWTLWAEKRPIETKMGYLHEGYCAPDRNSLGHLDQSKWERDQNNNLRDPWQMSEKMPFIMDNDEEVNFATGSFGGHCGLVALQRAYRANGAGRDPVIELGTEMRRNQYGGINPRPTFKVVGWVTPNAQAALPPAKKSSAEIVDDELPADPKPTRVKRSAMDSSIPESHL